MFLKNSVLIVAAIAVQAVFSADVSAEIRVRCDQRPGSSRISVDGKNLPAGADYQAVVISGANQAESAVAAAIGDEVEFDFSSRPNDVAAGATAIDAAFIRNGQVTGKILDDQGMTLIADTVRCAVRTR